MKCYIASIDKTLRNAGMYFDQSLLLPIDGKPGDIWFHALSPTVARLGPANTNHFPIEYVVKKREFVCKILTVQIPVWVEVGGEK